MREEFELNRRYWDEATRIHARGNVYGVEDLRAGRCRLHRVEVEEVGDVRGKSILHLQCHFGLDTLSWARRGGKVTGVDFSPEAIDRARQLSSELRVGADFVCCDIYELTGRLDAPASFDIVFTSYGVLCWLPDLKPWAQLIAHYLKPGGFFYIVEAHPTARMFPINAAEVSAAGGFVPAFPYFQRPEGMRFPASMDYSDKNVQNTHGTHYWPHPLGEIINALIGAGLTLEWLHEFPFCAWEVVAGTAVVEEQDTSRAYYGRIEEPQLPLMFSLKATKPAAK